MSGSDAMRQAAGASSEYVAAALGTATTADDEVANTPVRVEQAPGRNDPCPCGSGKKYKLCHGR